jgi:hypothetical protein
MLALGQRHRRPGDDGEFVYHSPRRYRTHRNASVHQRSVNHIIDLEKGRKAKTLACRLDVRDYMADAIGFKACIHVYS